VAQVATAANGMLALARIRAGHYDAVITDLRMPAMNGRELYGRCGAPDLARRVIFATGDLVARQRSSCIRRGTRVLSSRPGPFWSFLRRIEPQNSTSSTGT
jgi:CheY-like chemotaxis protein